MNKNIVSRRKHIIKKIKSNVIKSSRRLNDDRFLEEEENNYWGWIKGEIKNEQTQDDD